MDPFAFKTVGDPTVASSKFGSTSGSSIDIIRPVAQQVDDAFQPGRVQTFEWKSDPNRYYHPRHTRLALEMEFVFGETDTTKVDPTQPAKARTGASGPQSNKRLVGVSGTPTKASHGAASPAPGKAASTPPATLATSAASSARSSSPKRGFVARMIPRRAASPKKGPGAAGGEGASTKTGAAAASSTSGPSVEA